MMTISNQVFKASPSQIERILSKLEQQVGFVYLDSADQRTASYCVWRPVTLLQTVGNYTTISQTKNAIGSASSVSESDPFQLIGDALRETWPAAFANQADGLGFCGGAIGYWGYELGGRVEKLPFPNAHDIDVPDMHIGIYDCALRIDSEIGELELRGLPERFNEFKNELTALLKEEEIARVTPFSLTSDWQANMTKAEYADKFYQVKEYLASGDCYQINLAQRFRAQYQGDEWQAYTALRQSNQAPFSSFIRTQTGAILSLSPERFLQVKSDQIETKPIKGTRPRHHDPIADKASANSLKHAVKDRAENLMIVDLLRNDVSKVAKPGSVQVPKLFDIESYPAVHHLVSTVTAVLRPEYSALDLLRGAFPGGSITGAPKIRAMEIIHELEPHPRSVYCGAIGYILPNGDMDTNITIRTLVCNKQAIYCWAGGGLVADSEMDSEYQETLDKVNKILPILSAL